MDDISRGLAIDTIIRDQVFQDAVQAVRDKQMSIIKSSTLGETTKRENAYFLLKAMDSLLEEFQAIANRAEIAKKTPATRKRK